MSQTKEGTSKTKEKLSNEYLLDAAGNGDLETLRDLLEVEDINVNYQNRYNNTALTLAAHEGHLEIVKALLADKRIEVNEIGDYDESSALILAAREGHLEIVKVLLADKRVNINSKTSSGWSALWEAAFEKHTEIVKALLAAGADINYKLIVRVNKLIQDDQDNQNLKTIRNLILKKYIKSKTIKSSKQSGAGTSVRRRLRKHRRTMRKPTSGKHY